MRQELSKSALELNRMFRSLKNKKEQWNEHKIAIGKIFDCLRLIVVKEGILPNACLYYRGAILDYSKLCLEMKDNEEIGRIITGGKA